MKSERNINCLPTKTKSMLYELSRYQKKIDSKGYSVGLPIVLKYKEYIYTYWRTFKIVEITSIQGD